MIAQTTANHIVLASNVVRDYTTGDDIVHALRGVDLSIQPGEFVALRGRSGSGKTTLLNILVGLDDPTSGEVILLGQRLQHMNTNQRALLRRDSVGIMFQNAHLFPTLTALENVEIPLRLARVPSAQRTRMAMHALEKVGLTARSRHRGAELSGGEQQRVALARALAHEPRFLIADEPTGNLDSLTGRSITNLLQSIAHENTLGLLIATHDSIIFEAADRALHIEDGQFVQTEQPE